MSAGTAQPIVVTHEGGKKFNAHVRSHHIVTDQPIAAGGEDVGPMPLELLGAALGTCVALYVQQFCLSRQIPHEGMRVEVDQHPASNPNRIGEFVVRVFVPADLDERQTDMLERAARSCPAHHTLAEQAQVSIHIETPEKAVV